MRITFNSPVYVRTQPSALADLIFAIESQDLKKVQSALDVGVDPAGSTVDGIPAIHFACKSGNMPIIHACLEKSPNCLYTVYSGGLTLLHTAAQTGNINAAKQVLIYCKAGETMDFVNASAITGTALMHCIRNSDNEESCKNFCEFLIERGADPRITTASYTTALSLAKEKGYDSVTTLLEERIKKIIKMEERPWRDVAEVTISLALVVIIALGIVLVPEPDY